MKLGIYIGSFNPPHKGHIKVINYLLDNHYVDKILVVPTGNYWDKQDLVDIRDRIKMLQFYENDLVKIDTIHNNLIYTYELMQELKKDYPNDTLYLILGADNLISFDKWRYYQELLKYPIIVMNRDNIDISFYQKKYHASNLIILNDYPYLNISSTVVRKKISLRYLDKEIYDYIKKNDLYQKGESDGKEN